MFVFFLLCLSRKIEKQNVVWCMMTTSSGLKNLQSCDTRCWGQGHQCGSTNNICVEEEPAYENKQDTHKERERKRDTHKKTLYFLISTITTISTTLTKGYKVTLYSDYVRVTALYAISKNSPNLGCPKGQCEYGHYTLVFDTI